MVTRSSPILMSAEIITLLPPVPPAGEHLSHESLGVAVHDVLEETVTACPVPSASSVMTEGCTLSVPCKVVAYTTAKTGKHGHAKASITGIDIFNGKKYEDSVPTSHTVLVPNIKRSQWTALDVDAGLYSKIERGERPAKREQVISLASIFNIDEQELLTLWLADQVYGIVEYEQNANDVLNIVAENIVEYNKSKQA